MYNNFYHLKLDPFADAPDPNFLFLSPSHKAALCAIGRGVTDRQGIGAIIGAVGVGKTAILRAYEESLKPQHYTVIRLFYPKISMPDLLKIIGFECGLPSVPDDPQAMITQLSQVLLAEHNHGRRVVLIIDEAQALPVQTLAELLLLANLQAPTGAHLLHIVLAGLPALRWMLRRPALRPLKKRLAYCVTLAPLTVGESLAYIRRRLAKALVFEDELFTPGALKQIIRYAQGNPRILNILCANALITGELRQQQRISPLVVREVIAKHGDKRLPLLWQWGTVAAAALLLVAGLEWSVQSGWLRLPPIRNLELPRLTSLLPPSFRGYLEERPPEPVMVAMQPHSVTPLLPFVVEHGEPRLDVPVTPAPLEAYIAEPLLPREQPGVEQTVSPPVSDTTQVAAVSVVLSEPVEVPQPPPVPAVPLPEPAAPAVLPPSEQAINNSAQSDAPQSASPEVTSAPTQQKSSIAPPRAAVAPKRSRLAAPPPPASVKPQLPVRRLPPPSEPTVQEASVPVIVPERQAAAPATQVALVPPEPTPAIQSPVIRDLRGETNSDTEREMGGGTTEAAPESPRTGGKTMTTLEVLNRDWLLPGDSSRLVVESGGHVAIIRKLLFTADGRELISVSDDKTIRVWSVSSDGQRAALARTIRGQNGEGREGMIAAAALAPPDTAGQQRWLAVGGYLPGAPRDRYAIRLHDYASGEIASLLHGHTEAVLALAFSPTGRWLASAGKDHTVRVWDLAALQGDSLATAPLVYTAHTDHIYDLAWSALGHRLASASYDGTVGLWNAADLAQNTLTLMARLQGHDDQVLTVAFSPDSTFLASGGKDRTIRTWRAADGKSLGVFAKAKHKVAALAFSPDGGLLLAGNYSPPQPDRLTLFAYPTGKEHRVFTGHHNVVMATAFHPSGQWVASGGGEQKEILLWQANTGEILSRLEGRGRTVYAVGFSRDGRYVSWGYTAEAATSHKPARLEDQFDLAQLVRLPGGLPDASVVRSQTRVGALTLVTEAGGPYNHQYRLHIQRDELRLGTVERGHTDGYRHSAYTFTPDAQSVLSGGLNGVLRLYALDGQLRAEFIGHTGEIKAVAVSADGHWALSGANDQTLRLWSLTALSPSGSTQRLPTLTLFAATDGEWVAWTPEGFFAASPQGAQLIGYNVDQGLNKIAKYVSAEQLRDRFYRPAVIQAKLQEDKQVYSTARQPSELFHR